MLQFLDRQRERCRSITLLCIFNLAVKTHQAETEFLEFHTMNAKCNQIACPKIYRFLIFSVSISSFYFKCNQLRDLIAFSVGNEVREWIFWLFQLLLSGGWFGVRFWDFNQVFWVFLETFTWIHLVNGRAMVSRSIGYAGKVFNQRWVSYCNEQNW